MNNTVIILNQNSIHFFHIFKRVFLHLYNSTMPQMQITCKINQIIAILLHCEFPHKKSQIPFIHLVSSRPFTSFLSANSVQTSTKSCQISRFLRLRHTRRQNILPRIHLSLSLYYKLSPGFPQSLFSMR